MNSIASVNITGNNVNFGHKVKYSPEAQAEFIRQMDYYMGVGSGNYRKGYFTLPSTLHNYFASIYDNLGKVQKWLAKKIIGKDNYLCHLE